MLYMLREKLAIKPALSPKPFSSEDDALGGLRRDVPEIRRARRVGTNPRGGRDVTR